jgi:hypothetical protein
MTNKQTRTVGRTLGAKALARSINMNDSFWFSTNLIDWQNKPDTARKIKKGCYEE